VWEKTNLPLDKLEARSGNLAEARFIFPLQLTPPAGTTAVPSRWFHHRRYREYA
jgi:hypothetical protein